MGRAKRSTLFLDMLEALLHAILCTRIETLCVLLVQTAIAETMANKMVLVACLLIMVMDIVAGVLGIEAEIAQNKAKSLRMWIYECRDPSNRAFSLGLSAVVLLCLAHTATNFLGGCIYVRSKQEFDRASPNRQLAAASLVLSWIMLAIAFSLLISGTIVNLRSRKNCGVDNSRLLSVGGIVCFIHGLFSVAYYVSATAVFQEEANLHQPKPEAPPA